VFNLISKVAYFELPFVYIISLTQHLRLANYDKWFSNWKGSSKLMDKWLCGCTIVGQKEKNIQPISIVSL
jgi:hypothetical protein